MYDAHFIYDHHIAETDATGCSASASDLLREELGASVRFQEVRWPPQHYQDLLCNVHSDIFCRAQHPFTPGDTKQRSLGAQIRPPHSGTTLSLPIRYCRDIDEQVHCLYPLAAYRYQEEGTSEVGGVELRAEHCILLNSECALALIIYLGCLGDHAYPFCAETPH